MISIVMPVYNAGSYLEETIQSVLAQTYEEWELLIIDDCSKDASYDVALAYAKKDDRIHLHGMEKNSGGPAAPRNYGVELSQGEYIAFLDADDIWSEQKLEKQIEFLIKNSKDFTSCDYYPIGHNSNSSQKNIIEKWRYKRKKRSNLLDVIKSNFIVTSSVLIHRKYIEKFDTSKEFVAVEDLCMWLKIFYKYENIYQYQDLPMVGYRILPGSISNYEGSNKQNVKINYCLYSFLLYNNLSKYLPVLNMSICKNRIGALLNNIFRRVKI